MPTYKYSYKLSYKDYNDKLNNILKSYQQSNNSIVNITNQFFVTIRFYDYYGDGSIDGWKQTINKPLITLDNQIVSSFWQFNYDNNFKNGGIYLGFDQYAQYLIAGFMNISKTKDSIIEISGPFEQVSYMSATLQDTVVLEWEDGATLALCILSKTILDDEVTMIDSKSLNPYIMNNPSVMYYNPTISNTLNSINNNKITTTATISKELLVGNTNTVEDDEPISRIPIYRLDKAESYAKMADDIADDGCSRCYLYATKKASDEVLILQMKLPSTFFDDYNPDVLFQSYQTRYFSVSSTTLPPDNGTDFVRYYGVNSRMMKPYMNEDGYVYVFITTTEFSYNLAIEQGLGRMSTIPPVMTWGMYTGYVLGEANYNVIIRYREPDINWEGSPEHAKCYPTKDTNQPLSSNELGIYTPEIYGDSMENFLAGTIGLVNKDQPWPLSTK